LITIGSTKISNAAVATIAGGQRSSAASAASALGPLLAVATAAASYTLANAPYGLWPFAWIAPGLLLVCVRRLRPGAALARGVLFGVLIGYGITGWAPYATLEYFAFNRAFAWLFSTAVWLVYSGVPLGLLALLYAVLAPNLPRFARGPFGGWLWVGGDLLRTTLLTGMPWGLLGHTQSANLPVVQIAELGGVYAVSFIVALVSVSVAETLDARPLQWRTAARSLALPAAALAAVLAYGWLSLGMLRSSGVHRTVEVVQGNIPNSFRWKREYFERALAAYVGLTRSAAERKPDLIVWPENAVNFYVEQEPSLAAELGRVGTWAAGGFVFGGPRLQSPTEARNSAYFIGSDGRIGSTYDKRRLVPFAEYDPFAFLKENGPTEIVYTPGEGAQLLASGAARVGIVICYEVLFPSLVRELVRDGAELIVNLANDSWMDPGDGVAPRQHFSMAVLRAVETRRALVRAAAGGPSGFISPYGEVLSSLGTGRQGTLVGDVSIDTRLTPYVRWGDTWAVWGTFIAIAAAWTTRRRAS
jgi:apolipoprotein N-acyltransferase